MAVSSLRPVEERGSAERAARGKARRADVPRSAHGEWSPAPDRRDPVAILAEEDATRVPELVPLRHARMATSPFAFFRGAAAVMAADLAPTPVSGPRVQLCGDAHLANFGGFASPERELVFDLNDFDETLAGPWEWDVKRLVASVALAGRDIGVGAEALEVVLRDTAAEYRAAMRRFATLHPLELWYARLDERRLAGLRRSVSADTVRRMRRNVEKAKAKDSVRAFTKLAEVVDGRARIRADPPLIVPIEDLAPDGGQALEEGIRELIAAYRGTLAPERRRLFDRFEYAHLARKVVGVGSVGTRAWVILMTSRDGGHPLMLQAKEAERSVLASYAGESRFDNQGRRVVEGQRVMQAAGDILLGWLRSPGLDGVTRDFYVRQLWDWKLSPRVELFTPEDLRVYGMLCAWTLARAHARSGDPVAIGGYLGKGASFDVAVARFAAAYADQTERDHAALVEAIESGRVEAA